MLLAKLGWLMGDMERRVSRAVPNPKHGVSADRLEDLLSELDAAASDLEQELIRSSTPPSEQELVFLGAPASGSIAQFAGWARAICKPFAGADDATDSLSASEVSVLAKELDVLSRYAVRWPDSRCAAFPRLFAGKRQNWTLWCARQVRPPQH